MGLHPAAPPTPRSHRAARADDRRTIEGILYVLITGCRWQDLPREYGSPTTVWRRLRRWGEEGVWERIWRAALAALDQQGKLDWSMAFLDGSFAPAKKGGDKVASPRRGREPSGCSSSTGMGSPWASTSTSANTAEVRLAEATLDTIAVPRPRGRPKQRPEKLVADRGYDSSAFRHVLRRRGIRMCIPPKRRPAKWRPSGDAPLLRARRTIGSGTRWSAASLGWATSGGC